MNSLSTTPAFAVAVESAAPHYPVPVVSEELLEDPLVALYAVAGIAAIMESLPAPPQNAPLPTRVTAFHSASVPPISLVAYAKRLVKYAKCGQTGLCLGLVLFGRYFKTTGERVERLTAHRLLLASVVVAIKSHYDIFYSNAYYAQVGGISTREMNKLELALLEALQFSAMATAAETVNLIPGLCSAGQCVPLDAEGWPLVKTHRDAVVSAATSAATVLFNAPRTCAALTGPPRHYVSPPISRRSAGVSPVTLSPETSFGVSTFQRPTTTHSITTTPHQPRPSTAGGVDPEEHHCQQPYYDGPSPCDAHGTSPWEPYRTLSAAQHSSSSNLVGHLNGPGGQTNSSNNQNNNLYVPASAAVSRRTSNASAVANTSSGLL